MHRRTMLKGALALAGSQAIGSPVRALAAGAIPIVDSHIHLFDTARPGGVPWPERDDPIYRPALPEHYESLAKPLGIVGAIAIEASPLREDNSWLLDVVKRNPFMLGFIGDLAPGAPTFGIDLEKFVNEPLFLGIRCGNLWNRDLSADAQSPAFISGLKALVQAGRAMDTANPDPALINAVLRLSDKVPGLRIVIDHIPNASVPKNSQEAFNRSLKGLAGRRSIAVKLSEIPQKLNGHAQLDLAFYKDRLDHLWELFGDDRVIFGSDWPNSDHVASFADTLKLVTSYADTRGLAEQQKFFWKNSLAFYRWHNRLPSQPAET